MKTTSQEASGGTAPGATVNQPLYHVAAFDDRYQAERAVDELHQVGFKKEDIGFALRGTDIGKSGMITDEPGAGDGAGALKGGMIGGAIGALFGAVTSLVIPGIGPIFAVGPLASVLGFGAGGAVTGGIAGAMAALGMTEEEAHFYAKQFHEGKALVAVRNSAPNLDLAMAILSRHGGRWTHRQPIHGKEVNRDFRHSAE